MPAGMAALTASEQITLRRVAHAQSDVGRLCARDLERLRMLNLIDGSARTPRLTAKGWQRFDKLAKPVALASFDAESELTSLVDRLLERKGTPRAGPPKARRR